MATRTLRDLIRELEDLAEEFGDDTEVRLAQQPNWPFENAVGEIQAVNLNEVDPEDEDEEDPEQEEDVVVYIGEGRQLGYLPGVATEALGWRRSRR